MKLGILITYYNEKELLGRALRSIFDEKMPPEEVLIYDDASSFPAKDYIPESFRSRVRVIRGEKNVGPAVGRNKLLRESQSDYFKFHDTDDPLRLGWSEIVRKTIEDQKPDMLLFEADTHHASGLVVKKVMGLEELRRGKDPVTFAIHHAVLGACAFHRRDFLARTGGFREDLWQSEDHEFSLRVLSHSPKLSIVTDSLLDIQVRGESRSQKFQEVWSCRLQGLKIAHGYLPAKYLQDLCDAAADVSGILYRLGDYKNAHAGFAWARSLSQPRFLNRPRFYRWIARWNPYRAEQVSKIYRLLFPEKLRRISR